MLDSPVTLFLVRTSWAKLDEPSGRTGLGFSMHRCIINISITGIMYVKPSIRFHSFKCLYALPV